MVTISRRSPAAKQVVGQNCRCNLSPFYSTATTRGFSPSSWRKVGRGVSGEHWRSSPLTCRVMESAMGQGEVGQREGLRTIQRVPGILGFQGIPVHHRAWPRDLGLALGGEGLGSAWGDRSRFPLSIDGKSTGQQTKKRLPEAAWEKDWKTEKIVRIQALTVTTRDHPQQKGHISR